MPFFFSSPTSQCISSSYTSAAMSRSDSRDSATSTSSNTSFNTSIRYTSFPNPNPIHHRTSSSSSWTPPPYRSCLQHTLACVASEPSSYLSDDDLASLFDDAPAVSDGAVGSPSVQKELSTEEQIELLRQYREREEAKQQMQQHLLSQQKRPRVVRFASEQQVRRTSTGKRRSEPMRRS